jgi:hypothetical protein
MLPFPDVLSLDSQKSAAQQMADQAPQQRQSMGNRAQDAMNQMTKAVSNAFGANNNNNNNRK